MEVLGVILLLALLAIVFGGTAATPAKPKRKRRRGRRPATTAARHCECGCGTPVKTLTARYAPGHASRARTAKRK